MTNDTMDIILKIILSVLSILIPVGVKYIVDHAGKDKMTKALQISKLAKDFIIGYFTVNPTAKKDIEDILVMFKERLLAVLPLTDDEVTYLWEQISSEIIEALKIEMTDVKKVSLNIMLNKDIKTPKQKLLFK